MYIQKIEVLHLPDSDSDILNQYIPARHGAISAVINNKPINFKKGDKFSKTQDLTPIDLMVYSLMMWKSKSFIKAHKENFDQNAGQNFDQHRIRLWIQLGGQNFGKTRIRCWIQLGSDV